VQPNVVLRIHIYDLFASMILLFLFLDIISSGLVLNTAAQDDRAMFIN
jgi:hypothetical protein